MKNLNKLVLFTLIVSFFFINCKKEKGNIETKLVKPSIKLEKIIVINLNEVCYTYFKVKIENKNNSTIILLDNSLADYHLQRLNPEKKGFYLKNISNDSLITLGIDNYYFYEVGAKKSGYCFIGAINLRNTYNQKDSLLLRKMFSNYELQYNGKKLDLNSIKKSKYISQYYYDEFNKKKNNFIPFRDSLSISIPEKIQIKYINNLPTSNEEWNNL